MKKYEEKNLGREKLAQYLNEKFNEVLNPIKVPCHDVLKEIFPEMEFDVVLQNGLMQTLRNSINMDIVATCRYKNCREIQYTLVFITKLVITTYLFS